MSRLIRNLLLVVLATLVPGSARAASGSLEEVLEALVKDVKAYLAGQKAELTINSFIPHDETNVAQGSGSGVAIIQRLKQQLKDAGIEVKPGTNITLTGTFLEIEDENDKRQSVRLDVFLYNRTTKKKEELSRRFERQYDVTNEVNLAHLLGVPVQFPESGTKKDRVEALKKAIDRFTPPHRPKAFLHGNRILAARDSKFAVQIEVAPPDPRKDGKRMEKDYTPETPKDANGHAFVKIDRGKVYGVRLINDADFDVAVSLSIDGLSMFTACDSSGRDPRTGKPRFHHVIVPRGKAVLIRGWFVNLKQSDEFKVTAYAKSLAREFKSTGTVGQITACFHAAVKKGEKFPPGEPADKKHGFDADGTGRGARFEQKYRLVERKIGAVRAVVSVRYSK